MSPSRFAVRAFLSLIAVFVLATAALAAPYVSRKGYQITPAAGWTIDTSGLMGTDVFIFAPQQGRFRPNLNVITRPVPSSVTLERIRAEANAILPSVATNYKQLSQSIVTIGGVRAISTYAEHSMGTPKQRLYMHQVAAIHDGMLYTFTCTSLASNHAKYDGAFSAMLKSIRWHTPG